MDESIILSLVAEGESRKVDFKRELKLDSAQDKAEFVKDVISLANSSTDVGYLLIGIDNNKYIVGLNQLPEEQIQQVVHTYITPSLELSCFIVPVTAPTLPSVGVIEIRAINKPYKLARAIDRLNQDDVFVRRGSVVARAGPEEIIQMHHSSREERNREKMERLKRVKSFAYSAEYPWEKKEVDLEWLKANTVGRELGEVLYWEVARWDARHEMDSAREAKPLLDKAIELGYQTPETYFLRAEANESLYNYGLALQDIDEAILKSWPNETKGKYYAVKAQVLIEMDRFQEAYEALSRGKVIDEEGLRNWFGIVGFRFEDALLCKLALQHEFGSADVSEPMRMAVKVIAFWKGRELIEFTKHPSGNITTKNRLQELDKLMSGVLHIIRRIMGEDLWKMMGSDEKVALRFGFPTLNSQIPKDW
jgi:tetratricopeptide (TPR) repeat protein